MTSTKLLVTGATGYVGGRLVPALLSEGADVAVLVRSPGKVEHLEWAQKVGLMTGDANDPIALDQAMDGVHTAYYLLHAISSGRNFHDREAATARGFAEAAANAGVKQIIYLGGIANDDQLSDHLASRANVGVQLRSTGVPVLELRAGIVLGSGSASFEMLRYLTEHLPAMITPRWATNRTQPIAIRDVLHYLASASRLEAPTDAIVDIAGPETLTYVEMMHRSAAVAGLHRRIIVPVPLLTPTLSSLWVGLVTPVPSSIARPLVGSLINEVVASPDRNVRRVLPDPPEGLTGFDEAVERSLRVVGFGQTPTRWSDAGGRLPTSTLTPADPSWAGGTEYTDVRRERVALPPERVWPVIERIGGETGWYGFDWAWRLRGAIDRMVGGVGLRRGRRDPERLRVGDGLDFWRVELVDPPRQLRLRAEMRLPGLAYLQFSLAPMGDGVLDVVQRASFRPRGLGGHLYWWVLLPVHALLFPRMLRKIVEQAQAPDAPRPSV
jgi:uncharacterized protein YbjT (DUF2867 family)